MRAPSPSSRSLPVALACVGLSALLYVLLFPPFELTAVAWVALVPLLLAVGGRGPLAGALLTGLWGTLMTAGIIAWLVPTLHGHFGWSLSASLAFLIGFSAVAAAPFYAVAVAAVALLRRHVRPGAAPWLWVMAWVAAETARTYLGVRTPWAYLGDALYASERLRQVAALAGVAGVSALVVLANAVAAHALAAALGRRREAARGLGAAAVGLGLLVAGALLYGEWRLRGVGSAPGLELALVQGNLPPEVRWSRAQAGRVLRRYAQLTRDLLREPGGPPDLVVWPENALQTSLDDPVYGRPLRALAREAPLLVGMPRSEGAGAARRHYNSAVLLRPDGATAVYDKRRLLLLSETKPFGDRLSLTPRGDADVPAYAPGTRPGLLPLAEDTVGVLICMEALYPELAREAARAGASLLVNLSNDGWYRGSGGARQHLAQVVFRAVETGLPLARATSTGISALVGPDGALLAELPEGVSGRLRGTLPPRAPAPLYLRIGDAFAWSCTGACALAALVAAVRGRRSQLRSRRLASALSRRRVTPVSGHTPSRSARGLATAKARR